jgi:hypothetical protein
MWKILRNTLHPKRYKLQTYQAVTPDDKIKHKTLCENTWPRFERDINLMCRFYLCAPSVSLKVNAQDAKVWEVANPI